jgi:hypothetical protein
VVVEGVAVEGVVVEGVVVAGVVVATAQWAAAVDGGAASCCVCCWSSSRVDPLLCGNRLRLPAVLQQYCLLLAVEQHPHQYQVGAGLHAVH